MYIDVSRVLLLVAIWGPIGPLVGIFIGHYLLKGWQREQWLLDNVKGETRELLIALNALVPAYTAWIRRTRGGPILAVGETKEDFDALLRAYTDKSVTFHTTLKDRLFIGESVKQLTIKSRWNGAMKNYEKTYNESNLEKDVEAISRDIVKIANN
jgi:hypothetical protein